ncbi:MAG: cupin domain-containing protein [Chloroflexi bacterium]|nr:cupin domain-containing protein [Chloroflexota bacterium]
MRTAWRSFVLPGLFALLLLGLMPMIALGQAPPGPTIRQQQRAEGLPVTGPMEMVTFVFEFAPGAQTPPHTHQGRVLATVLEGEVTVHMEGGEHTYKRGESWVETSMTHTAVNTAPGKTRVMVSILTPKGAPLSQVQPGGPSPAPPAPATLYLTRTEALVPAAPYEVAQTVFDVAPGGQFPPHTHPGQVFVTVLDGAMTLRTQGTEKTYPAGESFVEAPGVVFQATNAGSGPATVLVTSLLPKGAPLSMPAAAGPGMPRTGAGGMAPPSLPAWAALLIGGGFIVGGWGAWRVRRDR